MFVLIDPAERKSMRCGDITIDYYEAPGDAALLAIAEAQAARDPSHAAPKRVSPTHFLAPYVTDVKGIGDRTLTPIPWPGVDAMPPGVPHGDAQRTVKPDEVILRLQLLSKLPWNVLNAIDGAVTRTHFEGEASGKG